jgi:hypothetical protein
MNGQYREGRGSHEGDITLRESWEAADPGPARAERGRIYCDFKGLHERAKKLGAFSSR